MAGMKMEYRCPVGKDHFQQVEGGNFCDLCQKKVHHLYDLQPSEVEGLLKEHQGEICGRVSWSQLSNPPQEKLLMLAERPLKIWEIWLLALFFSFGFSQSVVGQTPIEGDNPEVLTSLDGEIDRFLQKIETDCIVDMPDGIMVLPRYKVFYEIIEKEPSEPRGNRGLEIIVLRPFVPFSENSADLSLPYYTEGDLMNQFTRLIISTDSIVDFPWKIVNVHGHADSTEEGDLDSLSLARAQEVADWLKKCGLPNEIRVKGFGATKPVEWPQDPWPKDNRRVEIIMSEEWNY